MTIDDSQLFELRQYTLRPHGRDRLLRLFEGELLDAQRALGMRVPGVFVDEENPNSFVWLRGFAAAPSRGAQLTQFYSGPVWQRRRDEANATMVDSDDVLVLRPLGGGILIGSQPEVSAAPPQGRVGLTVLPLSGPADEALAAFLATEVFPLLASTGAAVVGCLTSACIPNDYPRLPVRTDHVLAWLTVFPSAAAERAHRLALHQHEAWGAALVELRRRARGGLQQLILTPTARSLLGGPLGLDPVAATARLCEALKGTGAPPAGLAAALPPLPLGDLRDFDFLARGPWDVHHRQRTARGVGKDDWVEFDGTHSGVRQHLGRLVNVDEMQFPSKGTSGLSFRAFDLAERRWRIWWVDSRSGTLFPPVQGGFDGPRGVFYGEDVDRGRPVQVRFVWTITGASTARWEQSFRFLGQDWEVNWVMDFRLRG